MFDGVKYILDNFTECTKCIKKDHSYDDDKDYYFFTHSVENIGVEPTSIKREIIHYPYDSVVVCAPGYDDDNLWIALNQRGSGITVFPKKYKKGSYRSFVITCNNIIFRYDFKENIVYNIPATKDEYFNLSTIQELIFTVEQFIELKEFLDTNIEIMKKYGIMLEVS